MKASIVVSGVGVAAAGAWGADAFARALAAAPVLPEVLDAFGRRVEVRRPGQGPSPVASREARRLTRTALLAIAAAHEALAVLGRDRVPSDVGVAAGTGYGSVEATRRTLDALLDRADHVSPVDFVGSVRNDPASAIARTQSLRGPLVATSSRRLSFEDALSWSLVQLARSRARAMVVAGVDEVTPLLARLLARYRLGERVTLGEGAAALLLETASRARDAGRTPLARVAAARSGTGSIDEQALAILEACARDGLDPATLDLFLTDEDGGARRAGEAQALGRALRERGAGSLERRAISDHAGHMPSSGAVVAAAGALAIGGRVPGLAPRALLVSAREADGSWFACALTRVIA